MSLLNEPTSVDQSIAISSVQNHDLANIDQCFMNISNLLTEFIYIDRDAREALHALHSISSYLKAKLSQNPASTDSNTPDSVAESTVDITKDRVSDPTELLGDVQGITRNALCIKQAVSPRSMEFDTNTVASEIIPESPRQRAPSPIKALILPAILPTRMHSRSSSASSSNPYKRSPGSRVAIPPIHTRRMRRNSSAPPRSRSPPVTSFAFIPVVPQSPTSTSNDNESEPTHFEQEIPVTTGDVGVPTFVFVPPSRTQTLEAENTDLSEPENQASSSCLHIPHEAFQEVEPDTPISPPQTFTNGTRPRSLSNYQGSVTSGGRIPRLSKSQTRSETPARPPLSSSSRRSPSPLRSPALSHNRVQSDSALVLEPRRFVRPCCSNGNLRNNTGISPKPNVIRLPDNVLPPRGRKNLKELQPSHHESRNRSRSTSRLPRYLKTPTTESAHSRGTGQLLWTRRAGSRDPSSERDHLHITAPSREEYRTASAANELLVSEGATVSFPSTAASDGEDSVASSVYLSPLVVPSPNSPTSPNTIQNTPGCQCKEDTCNERGRSLRALRISLDSHLTVSIRSGDERSASPGSSDSDHYSSDNGSSRRYSFTANWVPRRKKSSGVDASEPPAENRAQSSNTAAHMYNDDEYVLEDIVSMRENGFTATRDIQESEDLY